MMKALRAALAVQLEQQPHAWCVRVSPELYQRFLGGRPPFWNGYGYCYTFRGRYILPVDGPEINEFGRPL